MTAPKRLHPGEPDASIRIREMVNLLEARRIKVRLNRELRVSDISQALARYEALTDRGIDHHEAVVHAATFPSAYELTDPEVTIRHDVDDLIFISREDFEPVEMWRFTVARVYFERHLVGVLLHSVWGRTAGADR